MHGSRFEDGVEVIGAGLNQRLDRLEDFDRLAALGNSAPRRIFSRLSWSDSSALITWGDAWAIHLAGRGDPNFVGCGDLRGDLILNLQQAQCRSPMVRLATSCDR